MPTVRILIADDNEMIRRAVRDLLSSETAWEFCGEAKDGTETLLKARELLPDLVLLDISMPGMNGLEVARLLLQEVPEAKIIVMSQHDPLQLLPGVIKAGAHACVDKGCLSTDLSVTIQRVTATPGANRIAQAG